MDKAKDEAINKLIAGQGKMEKDISDIKVEISGMKEDISGIKLEISGMKEDISDLKAGQQRLETDVSELKQGQRKLETDVSELKLGQQRLETDVSELKQGQQRLETDVSELKQGQQNLETMMLKMIEEMTFVKKVVINIENDLKPQVKTLFDADQSRQYETSELKHICREQEEKLKDHELRISRLEKDKKTPER